MAGSYDRKLAVSKLQTDAGLISVVYEQQELRYDCLERADLLIVAKLETFQRNRHRVRCLLYRIAIGACEADGVWSRLNHVVEGNVLSFSERIFEAVDDGWRGRECCVFTERIFEAVDDGWRAE